MNNFLISDFRYSIREAIKKMDPYSEFIYCFSDEVRERLISLGLAKPADDRGIFEEAVEPTEFCIDIRKRSGLDGMST